MARTWFAGEANVKQNRKLAIRFLTACAWVVLVLAPTVEAQTILRSELGEFRCGLRVLHRSGQVIVNSPSVEYWKVGPPSESIDGGGYVDREKRIKEFSYIEMLVELKPIDNGRLELVPLQPLRPNQFQDYVFSIWECLGDSLQFVGIAAKGRTASPGRFRVSEVRETPKGQFVFFTESLNIDAGDVWGAIDVYECDSVTRNLALVYSGNYKWEWCSPSDTLSASWSSSDGSEIRLIRRMVEAERNQSLEEDCRSITVSADTSYWNSGKVENTK